MNATSLYVSTSRLVFQSESDEASEQNWSDLYRLVPYLRQSLSCSVCGRLLIEPYTPANIHCQHHVCKLCLGGRKNLKPTCTWCKDYEKYEKNIQLRILLQCYKSLCEHIIATPIYNLIRKQTHSAGLATNGFQITNSLIEFIDEGAKFQDNFKPNSGLTKNEYSILPCVFPNSPSLLNNACLMSQPANNVINNPPIKEEITQIIAPPPIKTVSNGSAMYSVLYTGIGNKITIKRKTDSDEDINTRKFQTLIRPKTVSKRRGCRCGNATATPGKLTCCGQRCPCYVDSKSCIDCKCRGCRNPHRPDGGKIRPHIPELACYEIQMADESTSISNSDLVNSSTTCLELPLDDYARSRLTPIKTPQTVSFTNHQIRQPISIDNVSRESLFFNSAERSIQVVNVFSPPHQKNVQANRHHHTITTLPNHNIQSHHIQTHQLPEISTTLPQILMQQQDIPVSITTTSQLLASGHPTTMIPRHSSISISPNGTALAPSATITLSPIIVTTSSSFPSQIFSEEEIVTTQCSIASPRRKPPPLIDLVVTHESNISNNLNV